MNENKLVDNYEDIILNYYRQNFYNDMFKGYDGREIRYICQKNIDSENALIILGGRTEFVEKYSELFYDLQRLDLTIYSYDHRGQGLSERLLDDANKGHVDSFSDYIDDLKLFLSEVVGEQEYKKIFILGFSLGGAIATLFQQAYPGCISAAILCCPMFAINTFPASQAFLRWFAAMARKYGYKEKYIPMGKPYDFQARFGGNAFTSSKTRYNINRALVQDNPDLALGSPTWNWLNEANEYSRVLLENAPAVTIPILLLQGGSDRIVDNIAHLKFCKKAHDCQLYTLEGSRHEILMERDEIRDQVLGYIKNFLNAHSR